MNYFADCICPFYLVMAIIFVMICIEALYTTTIIYCNNLQCTYLYELVWAHNSPTRQNIFFIHRTDHWGKAKSLAQDESVVRHRGKTWNQAVGVQVPVLWITLCIDWRRFLQFTVWFFWLYQTRPGIKPVLPSLEVQSPNCWTIREVPHGSF